MLVTNSFFSPTLNTQRRKPIDVSYQVITLVTDIIHLNQINTQRCKPIDVYTTK